jgi:hypothetical protein
MANDCGECRSLGCGSPQQRLQASRWTIEKEFAMKYFSHENGGN